MATNKLFSAAAALHEFGYIYCDTLIIHTQKIVIKKYKHSERNPHNCENKSGISLSSPPAMNRLDKIPFIAF